MANKNMNIDERLTRAQVAIDNALSDEPIKTLLTPFGYDDAKLNEGKTLIEQTVTLNQKQDKEYGEQFAATQELHALQTTAHKQYMDAVELARIKFRDNVKAWQALGLNGSRKKSLSGWVEQATKFYSNLLADSDLITAMSGFGYTQEKLQAELSQVQAVPAANANQAKETGEAQAATKERDAALDDLDQWMSDFKTVAKIALKDHDQWIEKLGLAVVA
ncbi:hypothetical protein HQ585_01790 [candidate division KSB1 bacterium]|nr:hypothetical protein [candidate division KSB1 bacterium]